jgi:hypothetical protein
MASLTPKNFHPDDPTTDLWLRLLRARPPKESYKPRTAAEKRQVSIRLQSYYAEHGHPRQGLPFGT